MAEPAQGVERPEHAGGADVEVLQRQLRLPAVPLVRRPERGVERRVGVDHDLADRVADARLVPRLVGQRLEVLRLVEHGVSRAASPCSPGRSGRARAAGARSRSRAASSAARAASRARPSYGTSVSRWAMQLRRARRLSSPSTTYQGASAMSVWTNISSLAREYSTQRARDSRSIGESFQLRERVLEARAETPLLLLVADREPVLDQDDAVVDEHALEDRALLQEAAVLLGRAEAHHLLDAGAVVPAPVEEHDLARGRQVRDVALEVPLALLALGRRRQRDDARNARVEVLRDALDRAALAGGVAALEEDHEPHAGRLHPHLQLHELRLEAQQLLLVELARHLRGVVVRHGGSMAVQTAATRLPSATWLRFCATPPRPLPLLRAAAAATGSARCRRRPSSRRRGRRRLPSSASGA